MTPTRSRLAEVAGASAILRELEASAEQFSRRRNRLCWPSDPDNDLRCCVPAAD
jgi:hypothetical protein